MNDRIESSQVRPPSRVRSVFSYMTVALLGLAAGGVMMLMLSPRATVSRPVFRAPAAISVAQTSGAPPVSRGTPSPEPSAASLARSRRTAIVTAVERVSPAVVSIIATQLVRQQGYATLFKDPMLGRLFTIPRSYLREVPSTGSGVILSEDGYVVTNAHVVRHARRIRVVLPDGRTLDGKPVGISRMADLAVLRIEGDHFPAATLGRSSDVLVGEWAIVIGNPFGLVKVDPKPSVAVGVISAVGRDFNRRDRTSEAVYRDMIQTDASINPGNSGGPLVNALGEVIGINTFIISESGGSEGIGFAIPIDHVKKVVEELTRYGKSRQGWTGLSVTSINWFIAENLGIQDPRGVIVDGVTAGSPAERAGIRVMDIIREINGERIANYQEARDAFYGLLVGDVVELVIERAGQRMTRVMRIEEGR